MAAIGRWQAHKYTTNPLQRNLRGRYLRESELCQLPLPDGLTLFYDLVHRLNSTLDLEVVLRQVIEQVNLS